MDQTYANQLRNLVTNPGSFSGTPGYQFALQQGLAGVNASNSRMRGSGNALAALSDRAQGMAQQDYGNEVDRLGKLTGQEQQYDLGQGQNANQATSIANQYSLGQAQNANTAQSNAWNYSLGQGQNANTAQRNAFDYSLGSTQNQNTANANNMNFGLGMYRAGNDFSLGQEQNQNTAQNNLWNYNLGQGQLGVQNYNAQTNRGSAQSNAFLGGDQNRRANDAAYLNLHPYRRVAGVP